MLLDRSAEDHIFTTQ